VEDGVVAAPLAKYEGHNLRVCRASDIAQADLDRVVDTVLADLGKSYDTRNFVDLALLLLAPLTPSGRPKRRSTTCLGRCTDLEVICSGMIARAFQAVGHPVLPQSAPGDSTPANAGAERSGRPVMTMRHHSRILPRDFDLSPNFEIVKLNALDEVAAGPAPAAARGTDGHRADGWQRATASSTSPGAAA
jgi:hypothetical protein